MLGMGLGPFLVLTVIGIVVALAYHFAFNMRFLSGADAIVGKVLIGGLGAWIGSPVLGHWSWSYKNIYIVPAILGSIAAIHLNVLVWKAMMKVVAGRPSSADETRATKAAA